MCMEMLPRGAKEVTEGEVLDGGIVLPPMKAFMDDFIMLIEYKLGTEDLLQRLDELFTWCRMKAIPKKRRSLSIIHGKVNLIHLFIIVVTRFQPLKSCL